MQPNPQETSPVGCSPFVFILVMMFAFFTVSASITPLNNLIARYALCPTASGVYFRNASGGTVDKPGVQGDVGTTTVTMFCEYEGGATRTIENDTVVVTGFAVSAGFGALTGLIVYLVMYLRARIATQAV